MAGLYLLNVDNKTRENLSEIKILMLSENKRIRKISDGQAIKEAINFYVEMKKCQKKQ